MKKVNATHLLVLSASLALGLTFGGCDQRVEPTSQPTEKTVEKNTTIINPPEVEKKVENNMTIVNPPVVEKKVENNTTIVNPPVAEKKVEKKVESKPTTTPQSR